jgi:signal transduction histidine kinase
VLKVTFFAVWLVHVASPGYTFAMAFNLKNVVRDLAQPLPAASYLALIAIWLTAVGDGEDDVLVSLLLGVFCLAWLCSMTTEVVRAQWMEDALLLLLVASALGALVYEPFGSMPILLILLASRYANRFDVLGLVAVFLLINGIYAGQILWFWNLPADQLIGILVGFASFQLFSIMVIRYGEKAERMAQSLQEVNANLMATRELLSETARDQERLRLSRELHDVAGHKLTALKLNLRALLRRDGEQADQELVVANQLANELLDDLRAVVRQLRVSDGIDLSAGLRRLAEPLPRPHLQLDISPEAKVPRAEQAEVLLRVAQESLTNAARHSQASHLRLQLQRQGGRLSMLIEDDGQAKWPIKPGNGLTGMKERIEALDGNLAMAPSATGGVALSVTLPVEEVV